MSDALRVEDYLLAAPAIDLGIALADASAKFAAERSRITNQRDRFDELCRLAEAEATPDQIVAIAAHLNNFERKLAAMLAPTAAQKSFHRLSEEAADIATTWLEAYQNAQIWLYHLASEKLKTTGHPSVEIRNAEDLDKYFQEISE